MRYNKALLSLETCSCILLLGFVGYVVLVDLADSAAHSQEMCLFTAFWSPDRSDVMHKCMLCDENDDEDVYRSSEG